MVSGSCLCGAVRWHYDGALSRMTHCHCGMCRKSHGTAFATYGVGPRALFAFDTGLESITRYQSSPGFARSFCRHCGSVLPNVEFGDLVAAPAGGFDGDLGLTATAHIFTAWKAPWFTITDNLTQHDNYPGASAPAVERASPAPSTDGIMRGGCLCGAIAYEVAGEFKGVHYCHCSRCRKARAAAHSTNGIIGVGKVHFVRGTHALVTYELPESRFFAQSFCQHCGSKLPRLDAAHRMAVVPLGSLDDDPRRPPDDHLYVDSKAPWYPITDRLPRLDTAST